MSKPDPSSQSILASGVPEGFDARILLDERARNPGGLVVHVARDDKRMAAMQAALAFFAPDIPALTFPAWDCLPFDRVSPNSDVSAARMSCLATLAQSSVLRVCSMCGNRQMAGMPKSCASRAA